MALGFIDDKVEKYTEAYNDYYSLVYSVIYSKVNNYDAALDLCQEVFIRFFEKFDEVENQRKWLYGTLRNVVLEYYRSRARHDAEDIDNLFADVSLSFVNGFRDTRIMIEQALEDTGNFQDEKDKILFELISIDNFTYKEAGAQTGLTERQVRYRYNLTVERLVKYFQARGIKSLEDLL